jgi:hypothetical protein
MRPFLILLFTLCFYLSHGQQHQLSVYKANGTLAMKLYPGDEFAIKTVQGWQSGELEALLTDTIIHAGQKLALTSSLGVRQTKGFAAGAGANLMIGGTIWPALVAVNGITSGARPLVTNRAIVASAVMLSSGALLLWSSRKSYKTSEPGRLRIIHFEFKPILPQP